MKTNRVFALARLLEGRIRADLADILTGRAPKPPILKPEGTA